MGLLKNLVQSLFGNQCNVKTPDSYTHQSGHQYRYYTPTYDWSSECYTYPQRKTCGRREAEHNTQREVRRTCCGSKRRQVKNCNTPALRDTSVVVPVPSQLSLPPSRDDSIGFAGHEQQIRGSSRAQAGWGPENGPPPDYEEVEKKS